MEDESAPASPGADLTDAMVWLAFGAAVLVGSITMDRLENQDVNPYTVPGLLPGLLGIALLVLGGVLLLRSLRRGARLHRVAIAVDRRVALVLCLCLGFGAAVGHGLPFWLAGALFVAASIVMLQRRPIAPKTVFLASAIGLGAGTAITLLFQEIFLVRLP